MSPHVVKDENLLADIIGDEPAEPLPHLWSRLCELAGSGSPAVKSLGQGDDPTVARNGATISDIVWTYAELRTKADTLASRLFAFGVRKGDKIAAFLDNRAEWALLFWVSVRLDAVFVPMNPRMITAKEEVNHVLTVIKPIVLVVLDGVEAVKVEVSAGDLVASVGIRIVLDQSSHTPTMNTWTTMRSVIHNNVHNPEIPIQEGVTQPPAPLNSLDQTLISIFTSGTTSLPKASFSTYTNYLASAYAFKTLRHLDRSDVLLQSLPVFHSWSICGSLSLWVSGGTVVFPSRSFDARACLSAIEVAGCTWMCAVPSMIQALVTHPSLAGTDLQSLQSIDLSGTMVLPEMVQVCMDKLGAPYTSVCYGMTEGNAMCVFNKYRIPFGRHDIPDAVPCGTVTLGARLRVCKPSSRSTLKRGEVGELHMGGLQVTQGYLDRKSDDFYHEDGINWIVSGDQARIDSKGYVYILGRFKDLIIRGGENLSPAAIERCINAMEGVQETQVVGIPDEVAGEVPVAVLKKKTSNRGPSDYNQIRQSVSQELGKIFSPQYIFDLYDDLGLEDFPRTTSGKIKKRDLKIAIIQNLSQRKVGGEEKQRTGVSTATTLDILISFWSRVTGRNAEAISPDETADTFADSITMMQFCNFVSKDLHKTLSVEDLVGDVSIRRQAGIVDSRPLLKKKGPAAAGTTTTRQGPPSAADIVHVHGNEEAARKCKEKVETLLSPHNLSWNNDVEDIYPCRETVALMTRPLRLRSWNRRHAYHIPTGHSIADVLAAIVACLSHHPTLRSMILDHGEPFPLYVILRPTHAYLSLAITTSHECASADELPTYLLNDDNTYDYAAPPGPMFRIMLVSIKDTDSVGVIYSAHHATFDAISLSMFTADLDTALATRAATPPAHTSYKPWIDSHYLHASSPNTIEAIDYHVARLRDWRSYCPKALWPVQRAPQFFRGSHQGWVGVRERKPLDPPDQREGVKGISTFFPLPSLLPLVRKQRHPSHPPLHTSIIFKAALALHHFATTHTPTALFGQAEASRVWPTATGSPSPILPNTMDIPGPTWEVVINLIRLPALPGSYPLKTWLSELQSEQKSLSKYAHAGFKRVCTGVGDEGCELFERVFRGECFNWLPNPKASRGWRVLAERQSESRADIGVQWNFWEGEGGGGGVGGQAGGQAGGGKGAGVDGKGEKKGGKEVGLNVQFDDCQISAKEIRSAIEIVREAVGWIVDSLTSDQKGGGEEVMLGDCPLLKGAGF
ncbi:MAG: hypothetical protein Q9220_006747 [cf. Caloplaca sp. 1 TL-2023]